MKNLKLILLAIVIVIFFTRCEKESYIEDSIIVVDTISNEDSIIVVDTISNEDSIIVVDTISNVDDTPNVYGTSGQMVYAGTDDGWVLAGTTDTSIGTQIVTEPNFTTISDWNGICDPQVSGCSAGDWYWDYYHSKTIYIRNNSQAVVSHDANVYLEQNKKYRIGIAASSHAYAPNPSGSTLEFSIGNYNISHRSTVGNMKYYYITWDQPDGYYGFEFYCNYASENIGSTWWYVVSGIHINEAYKI